MTGRAPSFAELTTIGVGGDPGGFISVDTTAVLVEAIRQTWAAGEPWIVLGGGSAVVASDDDFPGVVIVARTSGIEVARTDEGRVTATIDAGVEWDDFVSTAVSEGWGGVEALAGIPGRTGSAPIRNIGAYGRQFSDVAVSAELLEEGTGELRLVAAEESDFAERASAFGSTWRGIVTRVTVSLHADGLSAPLVHPQLLAMLGVDRGARVPVARVREAVMALREQRALNYNARDVDTHGCGPFFLDPFVTDAQLSALPADAPRWMVDGHGMRVSAEWLMESAGLGRGFSLPGSHVAVSSRHPLAITNRGGGSATEVVELARHMRDAVAEAYGIEFAPWPRFVGLGF